MELRGLHDDKWLRKMVTKYPESFIFRAMQCPETLTEEEMRNAVRITGDAEIALRWKEARMMGR